MNFFIRIITTLNTGDNVTRIPDHAFSGCGGMVALSIPDGVTQIGSYGFDGCNGLTTLSLPASVTSIREGAFYECLSLSETHYGGTVDQWLAINISAYNNANPIAQSHNLYLNDTLTTRLYIPDGVESITNNFRNDTALTHIYIPSSVTYISNYAFNGCAPEWFYFKPTTPPSLPNWQALAYTIDGQA